jgi:hypothetical protein
MTHAIHVTKRVASSLQIQEDVMRRFVIAAIAAIAAIQLSGCAMSETLFQSNFDPTPIGQPPAQMQAVGTATVFGDITVDKPPGLSQKFMQVVSLSPADSSGMQGNFAHARGDGTYDFSATLVLPPGAGGATIQFEAFNQPVTSIARFLHLDFLANDHVRIDDVPSTEFGTFPRNQPFIVQVRLTILPTTATAHIVLGGAGATGEADRTIQSPFLPMTHNFGAVRLWMGFPSTGKFYATNIVASRRTE